MDTQSSGADITGATLGRRTGGITAGEPIATPRADALLALAQRLDTENGGLDGLSRAIASLRTAGRLTSRDAYFEAAAVRRLEQDLATLRHDFREMHADRDAQLDIITERNAALKAAAGRIAELETTRDNLQAVREAQETGLRQQDERLAELREQVSRLELDVAHERELCRLVKLELADLRRRQEAARKASKTKAAKQAA